MTTDQSEARTENVRGFHCGVMGHVADPCPTPQDIVRYALDVLEEGQRTAVDRHLASCVDCHIEVEALKEALKASLTPEG